MIGLACNLTAAAKQLGLCGPNRQSWACSRRATHTTFHSPHHSSSNFNFTNGAWLQEGMPQHGTSLARTAYRPQLIPLLPLSIFSPHRSSSPSAWFPPFWVDRSMLRSRTS